MPQVITCECGKRFQAGDSLVGKTVRCPHCNRPLHVPVVPATASAQVEEKFTVVCRECGARYAAPATTAGRTLSCRQCGQAMEVPSTRTVSMPEVEEYAIQSPLPRSMQPVPDDSAVSQTGYPVASGPAGPAATIVGGTGEQSMGLLLNACRTRIGAPPREFPPEDSSHLKIWPWNPSLWMFDSLLWIYCRQRIVYKSGQVVWGHIVQANDALFTKGRIDQPAQIVYSFDRYFDTAVDELGGIAESVFDLKETRPRQPELRKLAAHVTNETGRTWKYPLPRQMTGGREVLLTTVMVPRKHLPDGYLAASFFPLLACETQTRMTLILSHHYWPHPLRQIWREE
jgi:transcription elongation factor Elf1